MRWLLVLALAALSTRADAASLLLSGPSEIRVGEEASYSLQIALDPGETIYFAYAQLVAEGGRTLAEFAPVFADQRGQRGFFSSSYIVDPAYTFDYFRYQYEPVVIDGLLAQPLACDPVTNDCQFLPDYAATDGPFTILPFSLTALAPGELRFVAASPGLTLGSYTVQDPPLQYGYRDADGNIIQLPLATPADGVYGRITILPEASQSALSLLALLVVAGARALSRVTPRGAGDRSRTCTPCGNGF